jgi:uncharacterized peroxidase-related enzyme
LITQKEDTAMANDFKMSLAPITLDDASGRGREVLEKAKAAVGFIPNMYANMVNQPALLETYLDSYGRFRAEAGFTPAEQEVVFLTISRANGCDYCMAAHTMLALKKSGLSAEATEALRNDQPLPDAKLEALAHFTRTLVEKRGFIARADAEAFQAAGYTEQQILGIVLALSVKVLSNYANHLFQTEVDPVFAGHAWQPPAGKAA